MIKGHYNKVNRPKKRGFGDNPEDWGPDMTEKTGYVPTHIKVKQMVAAGFNAKFPRSQQYDFTGQRTPEEDNPVISAARKYSVDVFDVRNEYAELLARQEAQRAAQEEKNKVIIEKQKETSEKANEKPSPEAPKGAKDGGEG